MLDIKHTIRIIYLSIFYILFITINYTAAQIEKLPDERIENNIKRYVYKKTPQGELGIYVHFPRKWRRSDKRSAIVFFFGGGWTKGKVDQFKHQADYLSHRGMISARADYRVKSRHATLASKCVEDGKSAVRWLRINANSLGIDPNRIVAAGGSAGGHVATCTFMVDGFEAADENLNISSKPNLLVLFNPVLDATAAKRIDRIGSKETAKLLSPNFFLTKDTPATIMFYGTEDSLLNHGKIYLRRAIQLGFTAELFTAEGIGHGFFNKEPWLSETLYLTDLFLEKNGYIEGEPNLSFIGEVNMVKFVPCQTDK